MITEIPYTMIGANIGKFLNDVCNSGGDQEDNSDIVDISNQSSKEGIRIVLELKRGADVENLTIMLYKKTTTGRYLWCEYAGSCGWQTGDAGCRADHPSSCDFQFEIATRKYQTLLAKEQDKKKYRKV